MTTLAELQEMVFSGYRDSEVSGSPLVVARRMPQGKRKVKNRITNGGVGVKFHAPYQKGCPLHQ